jgi:actin
MTDYSLHIVIDTGSDSCKAGFNGENAPRVVLPTVVGRGNGQINLMEEPDKLYIGREALNNSNYLKLEYPVKNGIITDFDKIEKVWNYLFYNELKTKPEAHNVFLTESLFTSNSDREKIAEIMFEKFSVFNIHMEPQPVMTLYSTTKTSGIIVESGESMTTIVPVFESYIIPQGVRNTNIAGGELTKYLYKFLETELKKFNVGNTDYITKKIKEKFLELKMDPISNLDQEILINSSKSRNVGTFTLPDGNNISIGNEVYLTPELLFNPLPLQDSKSIQDMLYESIQNVDIFIRKDMLNNIILGGGNTMIKNFPERLKKELRDKFKMDDENSIKVNAQPERIYSAWIGASVVCSIGNFQHMWISKNDFEEIGHNVIHKKYIF